MTAAPVALPPLPEGRPSAVPLVALPRPPNAQALGPGPSLPLVEPAQPEAPPAGRTPCREWLVLLVAALNSGLNSYLSMTTSSGLSVFAEALLWSRKEEDLQKVNRFFSYFLFTVMGGMTVGMLWAERNERMALGFSVFMNVGAAWLRWLSVLRRSYTLCVFSVVVCASGAWTILSLPAKISQERFSPDRRTLATSLVVQGNYLGWLVGALLPPLAARDPASLERLCFVQACVATPIALAYLAFYRPPPPPRESRLGPCGNDAGRGNDDHFSSALSSWTAESSFSFQSGGSLTEFLLHLMTTPRLMTQVVACGLVGGISFAMPSTTVGILMSFGFADKVSAIVNVAYLGCGIPAGIILSWACGRPRYFGCTLQVLFLLCTTCLVACAVLAHLGVIRPHDLGSLLVIAVLSAGAGASSLGFIGIGIEAATLWYPNGPGHVCWAIEFLIQGLGGGLNFWASNRSGFFILAAGSGAGTLLMLLGYRRPRETRAPSVMVADARPRATRDGAMPPDN